MGEGASVKVGKPRLPAQRLPQNSLSRRAGRSSSPSRSVAARTRAVSAATARTSPRSHHGHFGLTGFSRCPSGLLAIEGYPQWHKRKLAAQPRTAATHNRSALASSATAVNTSSRATSSAVSAARSGTLARASAWARINTIFAVTEGTVRFDSKSNGRIYISVVADKAEAAE